MNEKQRDLMREIQSDGLREFMTVQEAYAFKTKNPKGLRFLNLETALNITALSKFIGWPSGVDPKGFLDSACELIVDYISGPYIRSIPEYLQDEFSMPETMESWFDYVQTGLLISLFAGNRKAVNGLCLWVKPTMQFDCGIEDVSPRINRLYVVLCSIIRGEVLPSNFLKELETLDGNPQELFLGEMIVAIRNGDIGEFEGLLRSYLSKFKKNTKHPRVHEIISVDATNLCNAWVLINGSTVQNFHSKELLLLTGSY